MDLAYKIDEAILFEVKGFFDTGCSIGIHTEIEHARFAFGRLITSVNSVENMFRAELIELKGDLFNVLAVYDIGGVRENAKIQNLRRVV